MRLFPKLHRKLDALYETQLRTTSLHEARIRQCELFEVRVRELEARLGIAPPQYPMDLKVVATQDVKKQGSLP